MHCTIYLSRVFNIDKLSAIFVVVEIVQHGFLPRHRLLVVVVMEIVVDDKRHYEDRCRVIIVFFPTL